MELSAEEGAILSGEQGETVRKVMDSVVRCGQAFGARRPVPLEGAPQLVTSFGASVIQPCFPMLDELIAAGLRSTEAFTVDPRPVDYPNMKYSLLDRVVCKFLYGRQKPYEGQLAQLGLRDSDAFTCTCYLPEVGNIPRQGAVLAWSES